MMLRLKNGVCKLPKPASKGLRQTTAIARVKPWTASVRMYHGAYPVPSDRTLRRRTPVSGTLFSSGYAAQRRDMSTALDDDDDDDDDEDSMSEDEDDDEMDSDDESDSDDEEAEMREMDELLKPKNIVKALDTHIVGQKDAKRAVAIALRNRWRRKRLSDEIRDEVMPKNILMIGPTGVGKTEIARRLAKIANAPFVKVEATKYTEVGFHGRDVDTIIQDLMENALTLVKAKRGKKMQKKIQRNVEKKILDALVGKANKNDKRSRKDFRHHLAAGGLEEMKIDVEVPSPQDNNMPQRGPNGNQQGYDVIIVNKLLGGGRKSEKKKMTIADCRPIMEQMEMERLVNTEDVTKEALKMVQEEGIVFIDEIDKICSQRHSGSHSPDASAEGVQRDLLPLIEGSLVNTKHGNIKTDHILFIASGAFSACKPSDLLAELQGRLPIRVELNSLGQKEFYSILTVPEHNLVKQQKQLLATESVQLEFGDDSLHDISRVAHEVNTFVENIGARRLHTVMERIMSDISFEASDMPPDTVIHIDEELVRERLGDLLEKNDLSKFIL